MYEIEFSGIKSSEETEIIVLHTETDTSLENSVSEESVANNSEASENKATSEYMTVFPSGFENLPENATLMDRLAYGGKVALIGMATVFLILIIIYNSLHRMDMGNIHGCMLDNGSYCSY